jgi:hypothetical protein
VPEITEADSQRKLYIFVVGESQSGPTAGATESLFCPLLLKTIIVWPSFLPLFLMSQSGTTAEATDNLFCLCFEKQ